MFVTGIQSDRNAKNPIKYYFDSFVLQIVPECVSHTRALSCLVLSCLALKETAVGLSKHILTVAVISQWINEYRQYVYFDVIRSY